MIEVKLTYIIAIWYIVLRTTNLYTYYICIESMENYEIWLAYELRLHDSSQARLLITYSEPILAKG